MLRAIIGYPIKWLGFAGMGVALFSVIAHFHQNQFRYTESQNDVLIFIGVMLSISYVIFRIGKWIAKKPKATTESGTKVDLRYNYTGPEAAKRAFENAETDEERWAIYRKTNADMATFFRGKAIPWLYASLAWGLLLIPFTANLLPGVDGRLAAIAYYTLEKFGVPTMWNLGIGFGVLVILFGRWAVLENKVNKHSFESMTSEQQDQYLYEQEVARQQAAERARERAAQRAAEVARSDAERVQRDAEQAQANLARAQRDADRNSEADRRRLEQSLAKAQRDAQRAQDEAKRQSDRMANQRAANDRKGAYFMKACGTCDRWCGSRSTDHIGQYATYNAGDSGNCTRWNSSRTGGQVCGDYRKWSNLK
jgi:hypothetical protein